MKTYIASALLIAASAAAGGQAPFSQRYRIAGENVYEAGVRDVSDAAHGIKSTAFATVERREFPCKVVVEAAFDWSSVEVRPASADVGVSRLGGGRAEFLFAAPANVAVVFDGEIFGNLNLFVQKETAPREGENVYPPGYHKLDGDGLHLSSGDHLYIASGAWLDGQIFIDGATNVSIRGAGTVRPLALKSDGNASIYVSRSSNVEIDGLVLNQCPIGESSRVTVRNTRVISHYPWGDGFNVFGGSETIRYENVFARTSDDCTTVYATRKGYNGGARDIVVSNAVLWADVAHPITIGLHGNPEKGDVIERLRYFDIDILDQSERQIDYQGAMAINCGDGNTVRDVVFERVRIAPMRNGSICQVRVCANRKYCSAPGKSVADIVFRDVKVASRPANFSIIAGYDETRKVENVVFENLEVEGERISDSMKGKPRWYKTGDMCGMYIGEHADGVVFR